MRIDRMSGHTPDPPEPNYGSQGLKKIRGGFASMLMLSSALLGGCGSLCNGVYVGGDGEVTASTDLTVCVFGSTDDPEFYTGSVDFDLDGDGYATEEQIAELQEEGNVECQTVSEGEALSDYKTDLIQVGSSLNTDKDDPVCEPTHIMGGDCDDDDHDTIPVNEADELGKNTCED